MKEYNGKSFLRSTRAEHASPDYHRRSNRFGITRYYRIIATFFFVRRLILNRSMTQHLESDHLVACNAYTARRQIFVQRHSYLRIRFSQENRLTKLLTFVFFLSPVQIYTSDIITYYYLILPIKTEIKMFFCVMHMK